MKQRLKNNIPYRFVNEATPDEHILTISGAIGQSGWFYDATSAEDVRNALSKVKASTIRIKLSSGGGDAFEGIEIYNYLKDLKAHIVVEVTAIAASAASIIAMGADEVIMRTGSTMMIHEASTFAYGTKADIQKTMNALEAIDQSIVDIYTQRTGLSSEEIENMIAAETWLTADEALEKGFATSIETIEEEPKPSTTELDEKIINSIVDMVTAKFENKKPKEESTQVELSKPTDKRRFLF
jgi:ATP-dependent Clp protease, protease subunit